MSTLRHQVLKRGIFPFAQFVLRGQFWSKAREFKKLQWMPQKDLEYRQTRRLKRILIHAYENVPFYSKKFKEAGFSPYGLRKKGDIMRIPVITKEEIRRNFPTEITAMNIGRKRWKIDSTSGSSGEPLIFYRDAITDDMKVASDILFNNWCGIEPGDSTLWITHPRQIKVRNWVEYIRRILWNSTTNLRWLSVSDLQEQNALAVVKFIEKVRPRCLYGYTSGLLMLARCFRQYGGSSRSNVKAIISSAETLSPHHKQIIEQTFGCDVFNRYGMRELGGSVAQDCEEHTNLHVNSELYLVEITRDGESVAPGERGSVVVTDLHNMVMPIIRYKVGDIALSEGSSCSCGRGFPTIKAIEGRQTEFVNIRTPSGKIITHPGYFFVLGDFVEYIRQFQFVQEKLDELVVKIVPCETFNSIVAEKIRKFLSHTIGDEMTIKLEIVDEIPAERSGKRPIVKSRIPPIV